MFHALAGGGANAHAEVRQPALQVQRPHRCCRCWFRADAEMLRVQAAVDPVSILLKQGALHVK